MCSQRIRLLLVGAVLGAHAMKLRQPQSGNDLVFVHTPFNFGHTVENVGLFGGGNDLDKMWKWGDEMGGYAKGKDGGLSWDKVNRVKQPNGEVWAHNNPDLHHLSSVGCAYYYTPQKYWPQDLLEKYFGDKKVFGVLRDPYEHLIAVFRGHINGYGADHSSDYFDSCDLNSAIKQALKNYIAGDTFASACTYLPQAEYFEGPYGISIPIDNRRFPDSMNEVFEEHGYTNMHITGQDIMHVVGCQNVWAKDLDAETKALIRQVYARDFELICKHFGYCDNEEDVCLTHIPSMCPLTHFKWEWDNSTGLVHRGQYIKKEKPSKPTPEEIDRQKEVSTTFSAVPLDVRAVGEGPFVEYKPSCDSEYCLKQAANYMRGC